MATVLKKTTKNPSTTSETVTRKQLRGYGATQYLARKLTVSLTPVAKAGSAYVYGLPEIIASIRQYSSNARIQPHTKQTLSKVLEVLLPRLNNVVDLPVYESPSTIGQLAQQTIKAMRRTDKALAEMKASAAASGEH